VTKGVVPLDTRPNDDFDGGRYRLPPIRVSMFAKGLFDNVLRQLFVVVIFAVGDCRPEFVKSIRIESVIWAVVQIVARKT